MIYDHLGFLISCCSSLDKKNERDSPKIVINDGLGNSVPLSLTWEEDKDEEEPFILVQSKQKKKRNQRRRTVVISPHKDPVRPMTRSQKKEEGEGKAAKNHGRPTRVRDKPDRYK